MTKWLKRRWLEFRTGHNIYMIVPLSAVNFILIAYSFFFFQFMELYEFVVVFLVVYPVMTIVLGKMHFKYQQETDVEMQLAKLLKEIREMKKK